MVLVIRAYERKISYPLSLSLSLSIYHYFSFSFVCATDVKQEDLKAFIFSWLKYHNGE
jgi:hypothetical protein